MNRRDLLRAAVPLSLGALPNRPAAAAEPELSELWRAGEDGYAIYRIPGIVRTARGVLLAYCEARKTTSDWGRIDLMLRRSTDGGRTWDPSRRLVDPPEVPKNPVAAAQGLGKPGEVTLNNPVAIADRRRGVVHFLYCVEYQRCYYLRSQDEGRSWSAPREITATFDRFRPEYDWKVLATGPGHGIQLRSGRLLVPVWLSLGTGGSGHRPSGVSTIYSDDGGSTWRRGEIVVNHPNPRNPSETAAAELSDGRVMLNIRHEGPTRLRAVTTGPDGAREWSPPRYDAALPEPVCMGTLLRLPGRRPRLLFANPHSAAGRKNLTVKLSEDDGVTWKAGRALEAGNSAYSDLAPGPDGSIVCLYERGGDGNRQYRSLVLARFTLEWLRSGV